MEKLISKEIYKNINTGEKFYFKSKRGFLVVLENEVGEEIRTTVKKLESDYKLVEKEEKEMKIEVVKSENILTRDIIIEVGQKLSNGHLIAFEQKEENIEFLIETEENGTQVLTYSKNEVTKLAKQNGIIKVKGLKVVNKENVEMEFETINEFYKFLLKETGKEKINKGLLYNLKNGKSKSCYGYKLVEEN